MKIHQLPMGARFEYEGQEYSKTGPQLASGKSGQRLIPKYAVLKVVGDSAAPSGLQSQNLSREAVLAAFDSFHATCALLISAEKQDELKAASEKFRKAVG